MRGIKVTAHLSSPIAGDVPMLDAILQFEMAQREGKANKIRRDQPCTAFEDVHIPILLGSIGGLAVPHCSSPIFATETETVEHFAKRLSVENADLLTEKKRLVVATGNSTFKSYRLPLRLRVVDRVVWFAVAKRKPVLSLLRSVHSIGKKRSVGYGKVARWEAEYLDDPPTWFAECEEGRVLMRPIPLCDESKSLGSRRDFGAVQPPYWHPDRYCERVLPC